MNVKSRYQHQLNTDKDFAKKPGKPVAASSSSFVLTVHKVFRSRSSVISHVKLRDLTLRIHKAKPYHHTTTHQQHSVELTDDVIVVDRHGRRVLPPSYATLRIDQLPQFKKG